MVSKRITSKRKKQYPHKKFNYSKRKIRRHRTHRKQRGSGIFSTVNSTVKDFTRKFPFSKKRITPNNPSIQYTDQEIVKMLKKIEEKKRKENEALDFVKYRQEQQRRLDNIRSKMKPPPYPHPNLAKYHQIPPHHPSPETIRKRSLEMRQMRQINKKNKMPIMPRN